MPTAVEIELARDVIDNLDPIEATLYSQAVGTTTNIRCQRVNSVDQITGSGAWEQSPTIYVAWEDYQSPMAGDWIELEGQRWAVEDWPLQGGIRALQVSKEHL